MKKYVKIVLVIIMAILGIGFACVGLYTVVPMSLLWLIATAWGYISLAIILYDSSKKNFKKPLKSSKFLGYFQILLMAFVISNLLLAIWYLLSIGSVANF